VTNTERKQLQGPAMLSEINAGAVSGIPRQSSVESAVPHLFPNIKVPTAQDISSTTISML
jgi:hypothetical protein